MRVGACALNLYDRHILNIKLSLSSHEMRACIKPRDSLRHSLSKSCMNAS